VTFVREVKTGEEISLIRIMERGEAVALAKQMIGLGMRGLECLAIGQQGQRDVG